MNPYDEVAPRYDTIFEQPRSQAEDAAWLRRFGGAVTGCVRVGGTVLDIGCGTGWLLDQLAVPPHQYLGFDLSSRMVTEGQRKHPEHKLFEWSMTDEWPVPDASVRLVISPWISPSYMDPRWAFREARRVLVPGGKAVFQPQAPQPQGDVLAARAAVGDEHNLPPACYDPDLTGFRPWGVHDVVRAARAGGMDDLTVHGFIPRRPMPAWVRGKVQARWLAQDVRTWDAIYLDVRATKGLRA